MKWFLEVFLLSFKLDNSSNIISSKQRDIFERYIDFECRNGFYGQYGNLAGYHFELFKYGKSGKYHEIFIKKIDN